MDKDEHIFQNRARQSTFPSSHGTQTNTSKPGMSNSWPTENTYVRFVTCRELILLKHIYMNKHWDINELYLHSATKHPVVTHVQL